MTRSTLVPSRRLPEQPNLEQLRKQAKELLRAYEAGDAIVIDEVRQSERNPAGDRITLQDAQRILARSYGFTSWTKLKAFVDGANIDRFCEAVRSGDLPLVRSMLASRPELIAMDRSGGDEHRAIHYAVLRRDAVMVKLLMEAGADARKGIWPHRDATTAWALARDREYPDIVAVIEAEELRRREEMSCLNATVSPHQDQITASIQKGDSATAMELLAADLSQIHACDRNGRTPLHLAALSYNLEFMRWLLDRRANVRKPDTAGWTALDLAARQTDPRNQGALLFPATAALLLERGAELTVGAAVALGHQTQVREMIRAQPGLLRQIDGSGGLLSLAVKHGQLEMARLLLDLGVDVDERIVLGELEEPTTSWGMPLWYAALAGDYPISKLLLDRGADPNANVYASGWPLHNAWAHAEDAVKNLLLERGAIVQPYMVSQAHDVAAARRLIDDGATEQVVHELVWSAADSGCSEILEIALPHLDWPKSDSRWNWVLIQPIRGASSDSKANSGYLRCLQTILQHGVDPNVSNKGQTALHFVAARAALPGVDRAKFAALLLEYGASLSVRDDLLQSTPLGWACRWGHRELVDVLLAHGAPVDESDAEPWATPLSWARKMNRTQIVHVLEGVGR